MTTVDAMIMLSSVGDVWGRIEKFARGLVMPVADFVSDARKFIRHEKARRKGRQTGAHRVKTNSSTVWNYLHGLPVEQLKYVQKPPGQHRDNRGWRYRSPVWSLIERTSDERRWYAYWAKTVKRLTGEIQFMLDNPPVPVTAHGCEDCLCGVIEVWRAEMTEVNA